MRIGKMRLLLTVLGSIGLLPSCWGPTDRVSATEAAAGASIGHVPELADAGSATAWIVTPDPGELEYTFAGGLEFLDQRPRLEFAVWDSGDVFCGRRVRGAANSGFWSVDVVAAEELRKLLLEAVRTGDVKSVDARPLHAFVGSTVETCILIVQADEGAKHFLSLPFTLGSMTPRGGGNGASDLLGRKVGDVIRMACQTGNERQRDFVRMRPMSMLDQPLTIDSVQPWPR